MPKLQFLRYTIHLTDAAEVARLQGVTDPGSHQAIGAIIRAPDAAAIDYSAPILYASDPFDAPCITSPWITVVTNTSFKSYPTNVATFDRKSGGWLGISWLFPTTRHFCWRGIFAYAPDATVTPIQGEAQVAMARRRWIDGFEMPGLGDGGSGNGSDECCRGASRHLEGFGFRYDNQQLYRDHIANETIGGALPRAMWERFYLRPHRFGTTAFGLWRAGGSLGATQGVRLSITTGGQLLIENGSDLTWAPIPVATVDGLILHTWTRVDILYRFNEAGVLPCAFMLCLNGVLKFSGSAEFGTVGLGLSQTVGSTRMGEALVNNGHVGDIDDWVGANWPTAGVGAGLFPGLDWNNGSRITSVAVDHASTTNGTWAGANLHLLKARPQGASSTLMFTSTTAGDRLSMVTDAERSIDRIKNQIGIAALLVAKYGQNPNGLNGRLGYKLPGAGEVTETITENIVTHWDQSDYFPTGVVTPLTPLAGLEIVHVKGADAIGCSVMHLQATAEVLGQFYDEDKNPESDAGEEDPEPEPRQLIAHNAAYPRTPWALAGPPPFSPIEIVGGTYVGNGTLIEIPIAVPVHFLLIRNVTEAVRPPVCWSPPFSAGHLGGQLTDGIYGPVEVLVDPNFPEPLAEDDQSMRVLVRLVGTSVYFNAVGKTYQYIAFCDPGMRFCLTDVLHAVHVNDYAQPLGYPGWTPEYVMVQGEDVSAGEIRGFLKGIGHATSFASQYGAAEAVSTLTIAENALTVGSALVTAMISAVSASFLAWRRHDGLNDPGEPSVLQLATYTGDGAASRTINLAPASGKRPLFAIVTPHNGASYWRDPSHLANTSFLITTAVSSTTAITAGGIDQITVGATLNSNGIVYDIFILPGSATAGNGGWSINGDFYPVEPDSPDDADGDGPWDEEPDEPSETPGVDPEPPPPGPTPGDEEYDFFQGDEDGIGNCIDPSTRLINRALSYIGVSKQVADILTEASPQAVVARLHYSEDVNATLRDYPWAFATRYQVLTLVRGPAANVTTVQTWLNTTTYPVGDTVTRGGVVYYCLIAHVNHAPPNLTYWTTTPTTEANGDWTYAYRVPTHLIFARRIVNPDGSKRDYDPDPIRFRVGTDDLAGLIYTDAEDPELEYTYRLDCVALSGDAIFRKALIWRHAASLAPALARDEKRVIFCLGMYAQVLEEARVRDAREQQQSPEGEVDWIRGRD